MQVSHWHGNSDRVIVFHLMRTCHMTSRCSLEGLCVQSASWGRQRGTGTLLLLVKESTVRWTYLGVCIWFLVRRLASQGLVTLQLMGCLWGRQLFVQCNQVITCWHLLNSLLPHDNRCCLLRVQIWLVSPAYADNLIVAGWPDSPKRCGMRVIHLVVEWYTKLGINAKI